MTNLANNSPNFPAPAAWQCEVATYQERAVIFICFAYDAELNRQVRVLPGVR
ncbi:hypothetical protein BH24BAC1_BH24BAC1_36390 [soil metagenome]